MWLDLLLLVIGMILFLVWLHTNTKRVFVDFMIGTISVFLMLGAGIHFIRRSIPEGPEYNEIRNVKSYRIERRITITDGVPSDTVYTIYYKR